MYFSVFFSLYKEAFSERPAGAEKTSELAGDSQTAPPKNKESIRSSLLKVRKAERQKGNM